MYKPIVFLLATTLCIYQGWARSTGSGTCDATEAAISGGMGAQVLVTTATITMSASADFYDTEDITISLAATDADGNAVSIKGLLLYPEASDGSRPGTLSPGDSGAFQAKTCDDGTTITHTSAELKEANFEFVWTPPTTSAGNVNFKGIIVYSGSTDWELFGGYIIASTKPENSCTGDVPTATCPDLATAQTLLPTVWETEFPTSGSSLTFAGSGAAGGSLLEMTITLMRNTDEEANHMVMTSDGETSFENRQWSYTDGQSANHESTSDGDSTCSNEAADTSTLAEKIRDDVKSVGTGYTCFGTSYYCTGVVNTADPGEDEVEMTLYYTASGSLQGASLIGIHLTATKENTLTTEKSDLMSATQSAIETQCPTEYAAALADAPTTTTTTTPTTPTTPTTTTTTPSTTSPSSTLVPSGLAMVVLMALALFAW